MRAFFKRTSFLYILFLIITFTAVEIRAQNTSSSDKKSKIESNTQKTTSTKDLKSLIEKYLLESKYTLAEKTLLTYNSYQISDKNKAILYLLLAKTYKYQEKKDKALYYFLSAEKLLNKNGTNLDRLEFGIEFIEFNRKIADFKTAKKTLNYYEFFVKKEKISDPKLLNRLYNRGAAVFTEMSNIDKAIEYSKKAIYYANQTNDNYALATSYNELAFNYGNYGPKDTTINYYLKAAELFMKTESYREVVHVEMNRIDFLNQKGYFTSRKTLINDLEIVLKLVQEYQIEYSKSRIYSAIELQYYYLNDWKNAYKYSFLARQESSIETQKDVEKSFLNIKEQYDNEKLRLEKESAIQRAKQEKEKLDTTLKQLLFIVVTLVIISILCIALFYLWRKLKLKNNELTLRNKQKTILVQEIHHRVKNNLQFVQSILKMQKSLQDISSKDSIDDISRRIDAMSLVHEMLYVDEESMSISTKEYISRLMENSKNLYKIEKVIAFEIHIDEIELSIEKIIAIGVICSELFTNSMKHVFYKHENPTFCISLTKSHQQCELVVSDNGTELEIVSEEQRVKLGMRLIDIFSRQLKGKQQITYDNGYKYQIVFPI